MTQKHTQSKKPELAAANLEEQFHDDIEDGGAVYKIPEQVDRFLHYSFIAVLPTGDVAMARWTPVPEEDINLARDREEEIPRHTGLHMWKRRSPSDAADYLDGDEGELQRLGTIEMIEEKPHLDLDNPEEETNRPDAFK